LPTTTSTKATTQAETLAQLQALIAGLQKQLPSGTFTLVSTAYTTPALVTALQGTLTTLTALTAAHAALKVAAAAYAAEGAKMGPVIMALRHILQAMYANAPDTLAVFGMEPRKVPAPRTAAQKAASAAKAAATRVARGTGSKKKKSAIRGNVTGVDIVPITAPTAAATPATQAVTSTAPASPTGHVGQ
jgi:hypothetical protein